MSKAHEYPHRPLLQEASAARRSARAAESRWRSARLFVEPAPNLIGRRACVRVQPQKERSGVARTDLLVRGVTDGQDLSKPHRQTRLAVLPGTRRLHAERTRTLVLRGGLHPPPNAGRTRRLHVIVSEARQTPMPGVRVVSSPRSSQRHICGLSGDSAPALGSILQGLAGSVVTRYIGPCQRENGLFWGCRAHRNPYNCHESCVQEATRLWGTAVP